MAPRDAVRLKGPARPFLRARLRGTLPWAPLRVMRMGAPVGRPCLCAGAAQRALQHLRAAAPAKAYRPTVESRRMTTDRARRAAPDPAKGTSEPGWPLDAEVGTPAP